MGSSTAVLTTPERQNIHRRWAADAHRAFAEDDSGPAAEMGACGAVGVARQRRTPGDFVVLCYAGS